MDRYEEFRCAAIDRGFPNEEVDKFADQLRFAIWLSSADSDEQVAGQSGGLPGLPVGVEWPSSGSGIPLPFIASVDCAVLPRIEGLPLPEDGSLLFFLNHEDDLLDDPLAPTRTAELEFARVVYVPAGTETAVAAPPPGHDSTTFSHGDIPFIKPEHRLSACVQPALPEWIEEDDYEFDSEVEEHLFGELKHIDELCELVDELWPSSDHNPVLELGGHCARVGGANTPWQHMTLVGLTSQLDHSEWPGSERPSRSDMEQYRLTREWLPLAQFDPGSEVHHGCFLIRIDDLAAKRFDRMLSFTMFTE